MHSTSLSLSSSFSSLWPHFPMLFFSWLKIHSCLVHNSLLCILSFLSFLSSSPWKSVHCAPSSSLIPNPSISQCATVPCLDCSRLNTSLHPLRLPSPPPFAQLPCLLSRFSFSILFLLCRFQFLKASLCWMANGAPLSGGERKKENQTYKERVRKRESESRGEKDSDTRFPSW